MTLEMSRDRPAAAVAMSDQPHPLRWWWLAGALVGVVAVGVAGTAVNPGLPLLVGDVELSVGSQLRWVAGAMALGLVVLVVPGAVLGDLFGHARLYLLGAAGFTIASVLGATAANGGTLVAARLLQGLAAALVLPQVIGYARAHLPPIERAVACGLFGLAFVAGPVSGALLGSQLTEHLGWRWAFWVVVPAGAVAAAAAVPLVSQRVHLRVDLLALAGAAVMAVAAVGIMYPLTARNSSSWPLWYLLPLVAGSLLVAVYAALEVVRRGVRAGLGAPLVALLVAAGAAHLSMVQMYAVFAGGLSVRSLAVAGLPAAAGALVGAAVAAALAAWGSRQAAGAALGAGIIGAGVVWQLVVLGSGTPSVGTLAIGAGVNGVGLAMAVVALLHGDPASRVPSTPAAVFAALALGSPAGSLLAEALTPPGTFPPPGTPADGFGVLRDATSAVLVWSIGLLAAAVVVAVVLGLRSGAGADRPGPDK